MVSGHGPVGRSDPVLCSVLRRVRRPTAMFGAVAASQVLPVLQGSHTLERSPPGHGIGIKVAVSADNNKLRGP
jgi:hypothetical protein